MVVECGCINMVEVDVGCSVVFDEDIVHRCIRFVSAHV